MILLALPYGTIIEPFPNSPRWKKGRRPCHTNLQEKLPL